MQGDEKSALKGNLLNDGELLILKPRIGEGLFIDSQIGAIQQNGKLYFSFRELCDGLSFPLKVNTENHTAQGWYIREDFNFIMDLKQGLVISRGEQFAVTEDDWFPQDGEVYISAEKIYEWMKIEAELNVGALLVDFAGDEPFPIEDKIARRKRAKDEGIEVSTTPVLPRLETPYALADGRTMSFRASHGITKNHHDVMRSRRRVDVQTAGDFLGHSMKTFSNHTPENGIENFTFNMSRESDTPDLLGPLHARRYEFGDISPVNLPLAGGGEQELGARITNNPRGDIAGSARRTFEGVVAPDWDVELYAGDQLIDFQTVDATGRYRFVDVDLYSGDNDFRLIFYGPQGEVREELVTIPVDLDEIGKDGSLYDVSLSFANTQTYQFTPEEDEDANTPHLVMSYERGITNGLSVDAGIRAYQSEGEFKGLARAGAAVRIGKNLLNASVITDEELETAVELIGRRSLGEHDLRVASVFRTSHFSTTNLAGKANTNDYQMSLRGPLFDFFGTPFTYSTDHQYIKNADDGYNIRDKVAFSQRIGRFTLGQAVEFARNASTEESEQSLVASFSARTSIGKTRLRGGLDFMMQPDGQWQGANIEISRPITKTVTATLGIDRAANPDKTAGELSVNWTNKYATVSPRITYNTDHDMTATISVSSGLMYDNKSQKIVVRRDGLTNAGQVRAFVYFDKDGNMKFDGDDEVLPDTRVTSVQVSRSEITNDKGIALITNMPEYEPTDVIVDASTFSDPYFVSGFEGLSVLPRAGKVVNIDFPVHLSGEMDGTVLKPDPLRGATPASGLRIYLINNRGDIVLSSVSAFDGYYVISVVPPGDYLLMVKPDDLDGTNLRQPRPQKIHIGYDGRVLAEQNITLETGREIPLRFIKTGKRDPLPEEKILTEFGTYKSQLMAQVMKLRVRAALRAAKIREDIQIIQDKDQNGDPAYKLVSDNGSRDVDHGYDICGAVTRRNIECEIVLTPTLLLKRDETVTNEDKDMIKSQG